MGRQELGWLAGGVGVGAWLLENIGRVSGIPPQCAAGEKGPIARPLPRSLDSAREI